MKRILMIPAAALLVAGLAGPVQAQTGDQTEIVSIDPTSGPLGTEITVTVENCPGGNGDGTARLDFGFKGFTPASTSFFYGDANGTQQTAVLIAEGGEGKQNPGQTDAYVMVSQCKATGAGGQVVVQQANVDGTDQEDFTVTYGATATTGTTIAATPTPTSIPIRTGTLPATGSNEATPLVGAVLLGAGILLMALNRRRRPNAH